ncbi:MAG: hypothetical protein R3C14_54255 [Caldilineaceae bacterium]
MRVWLIGAEQRGTEAIRQLQKNVDIELVVSDTIPQPKAVRENVVAQVDYVEQVTSLNVNKLARRIRPDLILIDTGAEQRNLGRVSGGTALSDALVGEIAAICDYPCLILY